MCAASPNTFLSVITTWSDRQLSNAIIQHAPQFQPEHLAKCVAALWWLLHGLLGLLVKSVVCVSFCSRVKLSRCQVVNCSSLALQANVSHPAVFQQQCRLLKQTSSTRHTSSQKAIHVRSFHAESACPHMQCSMYICPPPHTTTRTTDIHTLLIMDCKHMHSPGL